MNNMELNFTFKDRSLFEKAVTHPSFRRRKINDFERLEFLGDRVLGILVAEMLYKAFPEESEGDLAKRQAVLISREVCHEVACDLNLQDHIKVVGAELDRSSAVMSDTMEALIGAIYLDQGLEATKKHILPLWTKRLAVSEAPPKDHKSLLQEWTQSHGLGIPIYEVIGQKGLAHAPEFEVSLQVADQHVLAYGKSRKLSEQEAARQMLQVLDDRKNH
jgi:ribonuclease III